MAVDICDTIEFFLPQRHRRQQQPAEMRTLGRGLSLRTDRPGRARAARKDLDARQGIGAKTGADCLRAARLEVVGDRDGRLRVVGHVGRAAATCEGVVAGCRARAQGVVAGAAGQDATAGGCRRWLPP